MESYQNTVQHFIKRDLILTSITRLYSCVKKTSNIFYFHSKEKILIYYTTQLHCIKAILIFLHDYSSPIVKQLIFQAKNKAEMHTYATPGGLMNLMIKKILNPIINNTPEIIKMRSYQI